MHQRPPIGSRPGTLSIPAGSPRPRIRVFGYSPALCEEREISDVEELRAFAESPEVTWVDVQGFGDEAVLWRIAEIFALHPLVLEDATNVPQRAKSQLEEGSHVIVARVPLRQGDHVATPQVCLVLGARWVLSFEQRSFGFFDPVRARIREGVGPIRALGPDYLAYALIDVLVDHYYPVVEELTAALDDVEDVVIRSPTPELLARLHAIRRQLVTIRRIGWPQREAVISLRRDPSPFVSDEVRGFLRDTESHIAQIVELVDSSREMAASLMDIYLSSVSQRTNDVMKVLTILSSIFIPITFVAGVYGMNFDLMPELRRAWGYPAVLLLMGSLAVSMIFYFHRRGWFGRDDEGE